MATTNPEWVTSASVLTAMGASIAVYFVSALVNGISARAGVKAPVVSSIIAAFLIAAHENMLSSGLDWFIAVANAGLLFSTVTGINQLQVKRDRTGAETNSGRKGPLGRSWL